MNDEKMINTFKGLDRFFKILQGFSAAAVVVCAVFMILTPIVGEKIVANANIISIGDLSFHITDAAVPDFASLKGSIIMTLIFAMVNAVVLWLVFREVRKILAPMKEGTPFVSGISGKIRNLAWIVLVGGLVSEICGAIESLVEIGAYDISRFTNPEIVTYVGLNHTFSFVFLIPVIILFVLAHVFRYGEQLQKESDETL